MGNRTERRPAAIFGRGNPEKLRDSFVASVARFDAISWDKTLTEEGQTLARQAFAVEAKKALEKAAAGFPKIELHLGQFWATGKTLNPNMLPTREMGRKLGRG